MSWNTGLAMPRTERSIVSGHYSSASRRRLHWSQLIFIRPGDAYRHAIVFSLAPGRLKHHRGESPHLFITEGLVVKVKSAAMKINLTTRGRRISGARSGRQPDLTSHGGGCRALFKNQQEDASAEDGVDDTLWANRERSLVRESGRFGEWETYVASQFANTR